MSAIPDVGQVSKFPNGGGQFPGLPTPIPNAIDRKIRVSHVSQAPQVPRDFTLTGRPPDTQQASRTTLPYRLEGFSKRSDDKFHHRIKSEATRKLVILFVGSSDLLMSTVHQNGPANRYSTSSAVSNVRTAIPISDALVEYPNIQSHARRRTISMILAT
ncbi:hypothetical protein Hypma_014327 [Hypsizygus marmoreus]|uniref:Uncharacterized protein n=1 Tax=Hypsizygus marmoreus TaxID=39966 RepID=A0A369JB22_HYPMA|nr:hypothetical protein Hypma_014327 [Hypsizygus marmoreus]